MAHWVPRIRGGTRNGIKITNIKAPPRFNPKVIMPPKIQNKLKIGVPRSKEASNHKMADGVMASIRPKRGVINNNGNSALSQ